MSVLLQSWIVRSRYGGGHRRVLLLFCKRVVPVQLEKHVSVKLSQSTEKLITNKLQVQCWLLWGWRLEQYVAEFPGGDSDSTPCQLVGREL
jgi:hypothetical protein